MPMTISRNNVRLLASFYDLRLRFVHLWSDAKSAMVKKAKYNNIIFRLNNLTDRDLADIGFRRADIPRIAAEELAKEKPNEIL